MTQVKITVAHPGDHEPNATQIGRALASELKARGLKRSGDGYRVRASRVTSGVDSELTIEVDTDGGGTAPAKRTSNKRVRADQVSTEAVTEVVPGTNEPVTPAEA